MNKKGKIGVFDSGIGGVTVLREMIKVLPEENYSYYSDSKNNPYGDKTTEEVQILCDKIVQNFIEKDCKAIVIACNTASSKAVEFLRRKYPEMIFVAIEPAYKMIHDYAYDKETLVMATKGTIQSERFNVLLKKYDNHKTFLLPCVGLADKIEKGNRKEIKECLQELLKDYKGRVENVVLGCTHYPLVQEEIQEILGPVQFFNGAFSLAKRLKNVLAEKQLLNHGEGQIEFEDSQGLEEKQIRFFELLKKR
jgi:glutamate racemase